MSQRLGYLVAWQFLVTESWRGLGIILYLHPLCFQSIDQPDWLSSRSLTDQSNGDEQAVFRNTELISSATGPGKSPI